MYVSRAILLEAFTLLALRKADVYAVRLSNVNGNPFMRRCFPRVNVNPRTGLVKLGAATVNPESVPDTRFVPPINFRRFIHWSHFVCRQPRQTGCIGQCFDLFFGCLAT